jgi:acyl-coenzyme A thioesterase PaaI-like protein
MSEETPEGFKPHTGVNAFVDHVGPFCKSGHIIGLRIDGRHLNTFGKAQGGVLMTMVDFAIGEAIREAHDKPREEIAAATVSLTTDFLGAVEAGAYVESRTRVERLGGTLAFVDCSLCVEAREVVRGRAVFAVLDRD